MKKNFTRWSDEFDDLEGAEIQDEDDKYVVVHTMIARESGYCHLNDNHRIRRGEKMGKIQYANNPLVPIPGWVCKNCCVTYGG